jgi:hypothetical protein
MSTEDGIRELEGRRENGTLAEFLHDELTYAHSTGGIDTKQVYFDVG